MLKSPEEIVQVRGACRLVDQKIAKVADWVKPGDTELQIGIQVAYEAAEESSFLISPYNAGVPVIATGPRSALPHGRASLTRVAEGDLLVIDLCAIAFYEAYHAGFTRTLSIGRPGRRESEIYQVVLEANMTAIDAVRPGVTAEEIDDAARTVIRQAGFGEYFTHRTGRGVGLDVSEPPYLRQGDTTSLQPGMTIVIEPGIYIGGFGGVRIEDTVLVTEDGHERLTRFPIQMIDVLAQEIRR
jgi:Xaa-Pro dipeptidase